MFLGEEKKDYKGLKSISLLVMLSAFSTWMQALTDI